MKKFIYALIMVIVLSSGIVYGDQLEEGAYLTEKAKVLEINELEEIGEDHFDGQIQHVEVEILSGKYKGQRFHVENGLSDNVAYNILVKKGDKVVVVIEEEGMNGEMEVFISDYSRGDYLLYLTLIFAALILLVGRERV